jgi:hypothetical protein
VNKGILYLTDEQGQKVAVQLDLTIWGELWEDFLDVITAKERENESRTSLEDFEKELRQEGLLSE